MRDIPFKFQMEAEFFEKAGAPEGQSRRIGGVLSLEVHDQEGEKLLQEGLDFKPFLKSGWFNMNHDPATAKGLVGYPTEVTQFKKGEELPNGRTTSANATWVEGHLLDNWGPADDLWALGKALDGTGRHLGFSVEGAIHRRIGAKTVFKKGRKGAPGKYVGNTVAKATVREVAITRCPVLDQSEMEILAKNLASAQSLDDDDALEARVGELEKALTMGDAPADGALPTGPVTGEGAGRLVTPESVEGAQTGKCKCGKKDCACGDGIKTTTHKSLTHSEARWWLTDKLPQLGGNDVDRFLSIITTLKTQGRL